MKLLQKYTSVLTGPVVANVVRWMEHLPRCRSGNHNTWQVQKHMETHNVKNACF